ncbi:STAS domain-containing protein [Actinophytocola sp.]|uniref:STAS domain-containing protein n=1 Tax=Actinophytocola sp. TaxID=1872138 RepID=UPI002ED953B3
MVTGLSHRFDGLERMTALAELERLMGRALVRAMADSTGELTVSSTLRGGHYTVVTVGGSVDTQGLRRLAALFAGLLNAGTRDLVVDLSRVDHVDDTLLELMRRVEDRVSAADGRFELTGLAPPVLYAMDDEPLSEIFAQYRATLDTAEPPALRWSGLLCPQGLDVAEPGSAARNRVFIDTAAHGRAERWGRRR